MTTISAKMILDSISPEGKRLSTFQLRYPWIIHSEGQTHRIHSQNEDEFDGWSPKTPSLMADTNLSRNAGSSRAIPVARLIQDVLDDPFVPLVWQRNQPGMQGADGDWNALVDIGPMIGLPHSFGIGREQGWLEGMHKMIALAQAFDKAEYHKQIVNRLLAPFSHIDVVVTATEWNNFFALRLHKDAEPHMRMLAEAMKKAMDESTPTLLQPGEWHLPYIDQSDRREAGTVEEYRTSAWWDYLIKISAARCAAVSFRPFDGHGDHEKELARYDKLLTSRPLHASPLEHQATPDEQEEYFEDGDPGLRWARPRLHGNFVGWIQNRKRHEFECVAG